MKSLKNNLLVKIMSIIIKIVMYIFILCFLAVVIVQRVFNNQASLFGFKLFNIVSESMIPKYQTCDILLAKDVEDFSELKVGDDIVYLGKVDTFEGRVVTHQIIEVSQDENGEYNYITKGINNSAADPQIHQDQILGKVIYKTIILSWLSELLTNSYGFYFLIFIPLCILIFLEIKDIVDRKKSEESEEDEEEEEEEEEEEDDDDDGENNENVKDDDLLDKDSENGKQDDE